MPKLSFTLVAVAYGISKENSQTTAFNLESLFGREKSEKNDKESAPNPRKKIVETLGGEEKYRQSIANAFGAKDYESIRNRLDVVPEYGVDLSYPMHRATVSTNYAWLPHNLDHEKNAAPSEYENMPVQVLGNKQSFYDENIQGCMDYYTSGKHLCLSTEQERIGMNLRQPQSMQNYTDLGFMKTRAPKRLMTMLTEFFESNKELQSIEKWGAGNTYTNHWKTPTYMLSVENTSIPGGGPRLKNRIWDAARSTIQEWTGEKLIPCSLYGVRIYKEGAILAPHVDRLPLVSSAIINVAQDVDEDWPIEVYAHDGKAYNITMEPGDMVLYESHSVIHGRPFPLKGRYYANVFIHFEPSGPILNEEFDGGDAERLYNNAKKKTKEKSAEKGDDLPPYIIRGTPEENKWRQEHRNKNDRLVAPFATGSNFAHQAASFGDIDKLVDLAETNIDFLFVGDSNGWYPLHEGVRGGHLEVVKFLVEKGVDVNSRTNQGYGGSALWWAQNVHGTDHPVITYLKEKGADRKSVV